jgi:hypothetical protein
MGFFKKLSAQLSKLEIDIIKNNRKDLFHNLSMDRQGEVTVILASLTVKTC